MSLKTILKTTIVALPLAIMVGCSGGGGSSSNPISTITGVFVDSAVSGVDYTCSSGHTGVTNVAGEFTCNSGDRVSFSLGGIDLGTVDASEHITPSSFFPNNPAAALNLAQLLQSLDSDGNVSNGIDLNATVVAGFVAGFGQVSDINFTSPSFDSDINTSLPIGHNWVGEADAQQHLDDTFTNLGINPLGGSDITAPTFDMNSSIDVNETEYFVAKLITDKNATFSLNYVGSLYFEIRNNDELYFKNRPSSLSSRNISFDLIATDIGLNSSSFGVTVNILDTPPTQQFISDNNLSIVEGTTDVYDFTYNQAVNLTLEGDNADKFVITSNRLYFIQNADFETVADYNLTLVVTDNDGNTVRENFTISVTNVVESPRLGVNLPIEIQTNAVQGTQIGNILIENQGDYQIDRIVLEGSGSENFVVDTNGSVYLASGVSIAIGSYTFTLRAYSDTDAKEARATLNINVKPYFGYDSSVHETAATLQNAEDIKVSDMNGDGFLDLVYINDGTGAGLSIRQNDKNGTFTINHLDSTRFYNVFVDDYDGDSDRDIIANSGAGGLIFFSNDGNNTGTYTSSALFSPGGGTYNLVSSDFDSDGDIDIIVSRSDHNITLYTNDGSMNFTPSLIASSMLGFLTVADMDGDGDQDIVVSDRNVSWIENINGFSDALVHQVTTTITLSYPYSTAVVDFDRDSDIDIIMQTDLHELSIYANNGSGEFNSSVLWSTQEFIDAFKVSDVNDDGYYDMVILSKQTGFYDNKYFELNSGTEEFFELTLDSLNELLMGSQYGTIFEIADLNNDGIKDILSVRGLKMIKVEEETILFNGINYNRVVSPNTGRVWLDRNIGASQVCTAIDDTSCYGDYYQWGRVADGHEKIASATTSTLATSIDVSHGEFITTSGTVDWLDNTVDSNGSLREEVLNMTNGTQVCPTGFRVPNKIEFEAEITQGGVYYINNNIDAYSSFLKLPSAGVRQNDGTLFGESSYTLLWTATSSGSSYSERAEFTSSGTQITRSIRASGYSIRCIKE